MICAECDAVFDWDETAEDVRGERRKYCSQTCKRRGQNRRRRIRSRQSPGQAAQLAACADKGKAGYPGPVAAARVAAEIAAKAGHRYRPLTPYECPCGWWHLTKERQRAKYLKRLAATPDGAAALLLLPTIPER